MSEETFYHLLRLVRNLSVGPEYYKVFKRAYRILWLLNQEKLPHLPNLYFAWPLPRASQFEGGEGDGTSTMSSSSSSPQFDGSYESKGLASVGRCDPGVLANASPPSSWVQRASNSAEKFHSSGVDWQRREMMHSLMRLIESTESSLNHTVFDSQWPVGDNGEGTTPGKDSLNGVINPVRNSTTRNDVYSKSRGGQRDAMSETPPLQFDSRFESGNLRRAVRIFDREYDLILSPDVNDSNLRSHWFFFVIYNPTPRATYKFNIVNLGRKRSLLNSGLRPLAFRPDSDQVGLEMKAPRMGEWIRCGEEVCYFPTPYYVLGMQGVNCPSGDGEQNNRPRKKCATTILTSF